MSHTSVLKTIQIRNIEALKGAVEYLQQQGVNCELLENVRPRMYYTDQHGKCDYVLSLKDSVYDVGFDKQADGSYAPVFDSYADHLRNVIGSPKSCPIPKTEEEKQAMAISRLLDCYAVHAAKEELAQSGEYYTFEVGYDQTDGSYTLEVEQSY